jgi:hypothetical protein
MQIAVSQQTDRSASDVFDFVAAHHFDNHPRWDHGIVEIRRLDEGAVGVGSKAAVRRKKASPDEVIEVLEFDPPRRFKAHWAFPRALHFRYRDCRADGQRAHSLVGYEC